MQEGKERYGRGKEEGEGAIWGRNGASMERTDGIDRTRRG
mgnify:CR=1 FL=1